MLTANSLDLFSGVGEVVLMMLAGGGLILLAGILAHWLRQRRRGGSIAELTSQKFSLAEANLNLLESKEELEVQRRQLLDQKILLENNRELLEQQKKRLAEVNQKLFQLNEALEKEQARSEKLLLNILPPKVAEELKNTGHTVPQLFPSVTVLFSDLVEFTSQSAAMTPTELIDELNDLFTAFDRITAEHHCERIKTIGDAYLAIGGTTPDQTDHQRNMVRVAQAMLAYMNERNAKGGRQWRIRIGIHTGSLVGGVVGINKYIYDIFGDTVNTAARLEQHAEPMRINVSDAIRCAAETEFQFESRPPIEVKGKGQMPMFYLQP